MQTTVFVHETINECSWRYWPEINWYILLLQCYCCKMDFFSVFFFGGSLLFQLKWLLSVSCCVTSLGEKDNFLIFRLYLIVVAERAWMCTWVCVCVCAWLSVLSSLHFDHLHFTLLSMSSTHTVFFSFLHSIGITISHDTIKYGIEAEWIVKILNL